MTDQPTDEDRPKPPTGPPPHTAALTVWDAMATLAAAVARSPQPELEPLLAAYTEIAITFRVVIASTPTAAAGDTTNDNLIAASAALRMVIRDLEHAQQSYGRWKHHQALLARERGQTP